MRRRVFLRIAGAGGAIAAAAPGRARAAGAPGSGGGAAAAPKTFESGRSDGRYVETAGFLHRWLRELRPRLEFRDGMTRAEFGAWQGRVRDKLLELMAFPEVPPQPDPERIWSRPRDGYRLERWEAYPEPYSVVPFYLLIPDGVTARAPAPAVLCFPGSTGSKEMLAGEAPLGAASVPRDAKWLDNRMAYHYARRGMVAAAFDSPATNETASALRDRSVLALEGIWMGRSYESISVFQKRCVLRWLARQPCVDPGRIALSGHSLGAKPADILGVLDPELVRAVVHNDFVCNWRERAVALNLENPGAHQVVPGILQWFDYTDLEAALAPCPLLFTEGGRANQVARIRRAYELMGAPGAVRLFHYEGYEEAAARRLDTAELPVGITMEQYMAYACVIPALHRFRPHHAVPWLADVFGLGPEPPPAASSRAR